MGSMGAVDCAVGRALKTVLDRTAAAAQRAPSTRQVRCGVMLGCADERCRATWCLMQW